MRDFLIDSAQCRVLVFYLIKSQFLLLNIKVIKESLGLTSELLNILSIE